ncbi:substrate binding domain-containing protein [Klebsiella quasipneumoniae]|uniref:substrate binding domain-containing protein n=1 Tax=Klebsiella quasipneumoniae TaxID=1463165 RepID=UPI0015D9013B|nr:substrate binding domain-containing protein [Klebsiella quasipneumoniae]
MLNLQRVTMFIAVVDAGSFTQAAAALAAFSRHHPALRVRHVSSSHHADLISERFDVAIRLGTLADSRYRATRIASFAILPVASPAWLASHPVLTLSDLAQADWIIHERLPAPLRWQLRTDEQAEVDFTIVNAPRFSADSATALMSFALAGCGIALLPAWLVAGKLAQRELVAVLPEYHFPPQGVYALYPDAQHMPTRVRTFIDFLREQLG